MTIILGFWNYIKDCIKITFFLVETKKKTKLRGGVVVCGRRKKLKAHAYLIFSFDFIIY